VRTTLVVYVNSDDALLLWTADELDDRLKGFAIQREIAHAGGAPTTGWLDNYASPGPAKHQNGEHLPSDKFPFRAFTWTDHSANEGDTVRYRAVPVLDGEATPNETLASEWSERRTLGPAAGGYSAFFNRGFVISQFVSRFLDERFPGVDREDALKQFKQEITDQLESTMRRFLAGQILTTMVGLLDEVAASDDQIFAALFELNDEALVSKLESLGPRAHLVLANGSIQHQKGAHSADERTQDENAAARTRLLAKQVDVVKTDRFVSPGALAHNKFLVVADAQGNAKRVWTGSTNWTTTGLCTQLNNGLLIDDKDVAAAYLSQWNTLREAKSGHPSSLAQSNGTPAEIGGDAPATPRASVHFTRAPSARKPDRPLDLQALADIVGSAKEGVLFLMFIPGGSGTLADVRQLVDDKPDLLVRGVVSELPKGREDEKEGPTTRLKVTIFGAGDRISGPRVFDVVQPEGMKHPAANWAVETTRQQFFGSIGHAIIHSKVLVVDPFSDDPTVVTGSHNFSSSASQKNDENFVVVRGDRALAEAYVVNVESAWRHYAGRAGNPHPNLTGIDYLRALLEDQRPHESFWRLA
jgi:phosphatidylserine/phosphatidylglycerophosphate/cardiolipin synthase-like enzyme